MLIGGVIVAAGSGERFGGRVPKAFVELAGVPLLVRSALTATAAGVERLAVVVGSEPLIAKARGLLTTAGIERVDVVVGGSTRVDSVRLGLLALASGDDDIVVIHDAARPLATVATFHRVIAAVQAGADGATAMVPSNDTIASTRDGRIVEVPDRSTIALVQTPQAFRSAIVRAAHAAAQAAGDTAVSDDVGLVLRYSPTAVIAAVAGDARNLKITRPGDLDIATRLAGG